MQGMKYVHETCRTKDDESHSVIEEKQLKSASVKTQRTLSVTSFFNPHLEVGPSLACSSQPVAFSIYFGSSSIDGGNLIAQSDDLLCLGDENYPAMLNVISCVQGMTVSPSIG